MPRSLNTALLTIAVLIAGLPLGAQEVISEAPPAAANVVLVALSKQDDTVPGSAETPSRAIARPKDFGQLRQGSWSYEVSSMAKAAGCAGDGAWIIDKDGGEETYQVFCQQPKQFVAVCMVAGCVEIE